MRGNSLRSWRRRAHTYLLRSKCVTAQLLLLWCASGNVPTVGNQVRCPSPLWSAEGLALPRRTSAGGLSAGDFAKRPGDRGSPPGSRVLWCSCVSVCQSVPGREAAGTRLSGTPVKAELLVVQWLRVWHTTLLKTPYIPPRKQSDLPRGPSSPTLPPPSPPPPGPPLTLPSLFFSSYYHHSFLSLSLVSLPLPWPGHPSSSSITPPLRPSFI